MSHPVNMMRMTTTKRTLITTNQFFSCNAPVPYGTDSVCDTVNMTLPCAFSTLFRYNLQWVCRKLQHSIFKKTSTRDHRSHLQYIFSIYYIVSPRDKLSLKPLVERSHNNTTLIMIKVWKYNCTHARSNDFVGSFADCGW